MLRQAICDCAGPVAIRYPRGGEGEYREDRSADGLFTTLREGKDCCIVAYGTLVNQAMSAAALLHDRGVEAQVVKMNRISPLDEEKTCDFLGNKRCLLVLEDCLAAGCVGQQITGILGQRSAAPKQLILKNLGARVPDHGTVAQLYERYGLDASSAAAAIEEALD